MNPYTKNEAGKTARVIRTFICIEISASIKARLAALQEDVRKLEAQVSWVKPANIHLTLKFLGDVPQAKLPQIIEAVRRISGSCSPFEVEVSGTGCFPSPRKPNVLWIGLAKLPQSLITLQQSLEDELEREGFARESKPFKPHLTIGRIRQPRNAALLAEELLKPGFASESFAVHEVIVMHSDLMPRGAIYIPLATIPLGSL